MSNKFSEKQLLIGTVVATVVLVGGLVALILSDRSEIQDIEGEIQTIEAQIQACDVEIKKAPKREESVLVFRAVEDRELAVLPTKQRIADFLLNLSQFFDKAGVRFHNAPESSPTESELAKGIFETRTKLTFTGNASSILNFMNLVENDPRLIAIKGYRISAGVPDREEPLKPIEHDVEMTLATYFYNPAAASVQRVHIPNESARLQAEQIRTAIQAFQPERPDSYVLRPASSRRDPYLDPRERRVAPDNAEFHEQFQVEQALLAELEDLYGTLTEDVETENALRAEGQLFPADRKARDNDEMLGDLRSRIQHAVELKTITVPELQARLLSVRDDLERLAAGRRPRDIQITVSVAQRMADKLQTLFEAGDYKGITSETSGWDSYVRGKSPTPEAEPVLARIRALRRDAKDLADFQALGLRVEGVVIDHTDPANSMARINRHNYRAGDRLDDQGDLVLGRIRQDVVQIRFRGKTMTVGVGARAQADRSFSPAGAGGDANGR